MEKFNINLNLDDPAEVNEFINKYRTKGRELAKQLNISGKNSVKLANALYAYAWNKKTAMDYRLNGHIERAQVYENICDQIYNQDINQICNCW